ncbi:SOS response-associated peptidase [Paenibacillus sp. HJGM_3]|uniref:SOS response-associated peptidase n=1 Tax=Paenibacillus sp. HJGM_3 TaxID=3379816 RepID=UPI00385909DE
MFTRFSLSADTREVADRFSIDKVLVGYSKGDLQPSQPIPVLYAHQGETCLDMLTWGLFPCWAKDSINAASETIHEKRGYKRNLTKWRCVIPTEAFYSELQEGKVTKTVEFKFPDHKVFGVAGLYDVWDFPDGSKYRTCTVLTTASNRVVSEYSERMPVILDEASVQRWLDPTVTEMDDLLPLLRAYETEPISATVH